MATITNKTRLPLSVPLPGGKKLHLGPLKSAEVSPKAAQHPPVVKLVEAGQVEVHLPTSKPKPAGAGGSGPPAASGGPGQGGRHRQSGDR